MIWRPWRVPLTKPAFSSALRWKDVVEAGIESLSASSPAGKPVGVCASSRRRTLSRLSCPSAPKIWEASDCSMFPEIRWVRTADARMWPQPDVRRKRRDRHSTERNTPGSTGSLSVASPQLRVVSPFDLRPGRFHKPNDFLRDRHVIETFCQFLSVRVDPIKELQRCLSVFRLGLHLLH